VPPDLTIWRIAGLRVILFAVGWSQLDCVGRDGCATGWQALRVTLKLGIEGPLEVTFTFGFGDG
jgi:hypothetical protein